MEKARSAIYQNKTDKKSLPTVELFKKAAAKSPQAVQVWLDRLQQIPGNARQNLFEQYPPDEITPLARQFALNLLTLNEKRLLEN